MVTIFVSCLILGIGLQYVAHIIDYPRRKYNKGFVVFTQHQKPEPFWYYVMTEFNSGLFWIGILGLIGLFILNYLI